MQTHTTVLMTRSSISILIYAIFLFITRVALNVIGLFVWNHFLEKKKHFAH